MTITQEKKKLRLDIRLLRKCALKYRKFSDRLERLLLRKTLPSSMAYHVLDSVQLDSDDCALCEVYYGEEVADVRDCCAGCPIREDTGKKFCENTPYTGRRPAAKNIRWLLYDAKDSLLLYDMKKLLRRCKEEADYLENLNDKLAARLNSLTKPSKTKTHGQ